MRNMFQKVRASLMAEGEPNATAILVTHNSASCIAAALATVEGCKRIEQIIVVDNASTDDTVTVVREACPRARIIRNNENLGFGRANNQALWETETGFALLMNPDALISTPCIEALLQAAMLYPEAAILAPQLTDLQGNLLESYKRNVFSRERRPGKYIEPDGDLCADWVSGALWLVRMDAIRKMGGFDEKLFLYYEDDDLCLHAEEAGYSVVVVADAKASHAVGKSSTYNAEEERMKQYQMIRSRLYLQEKYYGREEARQLARKIMLMTRLKKLGNLLIGRFGKLHRYGPRMQAAEAYLERQ